MISNTLPSILFSFNFFRRMSLGTVSKTLVESTKQPKIFWFFLWQYFCIKLLSMIWGSDLLFPATKPSWAGENKGMFEKTGTLKVQFLGYRMEYFSTRYLGMVLGTIPLHWTLLLIFLYAFLPQIFSSSPYILNFPVHHGPILERGTKSWCFFQRCEVYSADW